MKTPFTGYFRKFFQKKSASKPLISSELDIALLKSVRKQPYPKWNQIRQFKRFLSAGEKKTFGIAILVLSLGVVWFGFLFVKHHTVPVPKVGGDYVEGTVGAPALINPLFSSLNDVDKDLVRLVYSGLLKVNERGDLVADLAENYSLSDDKKTYTFHLKKNVVWHDGEPFTSKDVTFTFDLIQNSEVGSPLALSFQGVKVEATDDYIVQFTLPEVYAPFPSSLTLAIVPEHIWGDIPFGQIRLARHNLQPIGTGPFQFGKIVADKTGFISEYTLDRFDRYYAGPAYLEHFSFHFFAGYEGGDAASSAVEALREQNIDGVNFVPVGLKEKVDRRHLSLYNPSLPQYTALFFNQKQQPILVDKDVRLALAKAIHRETIIKETQKGDAKLIHGPILEGDPGYFVPTTTLSYSLEEANTLLDKTLSRVSVDDLRKSRAQELEKEWVAQNSVSSTTDTSSSTQQISVSSTLSGIPKEEFINNELNEEFSGAQTMFRKTKKGNIVSVKLLTVDTPEYRKAAELIAGFWQEVGIKTIVQYVSPKSLSRDILRDRSYDVLLYGVLLGSDTDQYPFWHSSQTAYPGLNLSLYANKTVDDLLEKIRVTGDEAEEGKLAMDFSSKVIEDIPAVFLYSPTYHYAIADKVKGVDLSRITEPADRLNGVTKWYIETKSQWKSE